MNGTLRTTLLVTVVAALGCGDDSASFDGGMDTGSMFDGGPTDAGPGNDSGPAFDGGADFDGGPDAGPGTDAGPGDAGEPGDAGPPEEVRAFPGAEGHGAESLGGRGGIVVKVTNLNDSGPGSLRAALTMTVPRIIVFEVSGTIDLESRISVRPANSHFTLAGQTAPGDGIAIRNHGLLLRTEHAVIRHIRVRHGCPEGCDVSIADNINIFGGSSNIILDHLSMSWAQDEVFSIWGDDVHNVTVQWSLMAEGTLLCVGDGHNLGPLLGGGVDHRQITFANNYLAHMCYRNFLQGTGQYEFINNVSYNIRSFDYHFTQNRHTGPGMFMGDVIGHYFKEGPQTRRHPAFDVLREGSSAEFGPFMPISLYLSDITYVTREGEPRPGYDGDPYSLVRTRSLGTMEEPTWERRAMAAAPPRFPVDTAPSGDAAARVLASVGASLQRDPVDERIVGDFADQGIWEEANVRVYPVLETADVPVDSDDDGMPDAWEMANGLDAMDGTDHSGDINGDGYTNIENYINSLVE